jgi:Gram-negative bacterial TonB protein C-terminal/PilZ domain
MDLPSLRPNIAGLTSAVQQAEMEVLLAGRWPPLKPLPIFKFETDEFRASVEFDKTRGEWVCRKTSLPSNRITELRGGLAEISAALPQGHGQGPAECAAAEQQEQESEKETARRLHAILEWRENHESGALYSSLQRYLSKHQQDEIDVGIRLTLTARQLQFNPKNVADVFDALSKAGGKLATLIEAAQRNKTEQRADVPPEVPEQVPAIAGTSVPSTKRNLLVETIPPSCDRRLQMRATLASCAYTALDDINGGVVLNISETGMAVAATDPLVIADYLPRIRFRLPNVEHRIEVSAQVVWLAESKKNVGIRFVDLSTETRNQIASWIASVKTSPEIERLTPGPVQSLFPAPLESVSEAPKWTVVPEQEQYPALELMARAASGPSEFVRPEIQDASPPRFLEDLPLEAGHDAFAPGFGPRARAGRAEWPASPIENSPSRSFILGLSGLRVGALIFLFALITLAVGLTAGRSALGLLLRDTQKSLPATDHTSQALLNRQRASTSQPSTPRTPDASVTPAMNPPAPTTAESHTESPVARALNAPAENSTPSMAPIGPSPATTIPSLPDPGSTEASSDRDGSTGLSARNAPPPSDSQPAPSSRAAVPKSAAPASLAPANPAARNAIPATRVMPRLSSPSTILFTGPSDGSKPFRLILPEKPIAASSSFAITSQLSILVAPERGRAQAREPSRLQSGELISFVWPRYPRPGDRRRSSETIKVRTTIGEFGQVLDVKRVSGSLSLLPAAISAIRLWRYKPTLLNNRPVQTQQDVTIEFRPPKHFPRTPTRYSAQH